LRLPGLPNLLMGISFHFEELLLGFATSNGVKSRRVIAIAGERLFTLPHHGSST